MFSLFFPWGVLLQALAIVHFIRRRPDTIWLWVIIFLGPLGALVYIALEVVPDLGLLRQSCYAKAISPRSDSIDAIYRRGIAAIHLGDFPAALQDLEYVTARDPKYDFH